MDFVSSLTYYAPSFIHLLLQPSSTEAQRFNPAVRPREAERRPLSGTSLATREVTSVTSIHDRYLFSGVSQF
jgi:hypothetical protein